MKITLIRTGGTIGSEKGGGVIALSPSAAVSLDGFDVKTVTPYYELSERIGAYHYDLLLKAVTAELKASDGLLITHGTDTLPFTAAVIAFALGAADKPIVFVSSDRPLSDKKASGHKSLKSAAAMLKTGEGGVYVADGGNIFFAARLLESRAFDGKYFAPMDSVCAVVLGDTVVFKERAKICGAYPPLSGIHPKKIICVKPYPDLDYDSINAINADCVLHDSYHSGTCNEAKLNAFASGIDCPLYLVGGRQDLIYSSKAGYGGKVKVFDSITFPAMYAKLLTALNLFGDCRQADEYLRTNICGEFF